MRLWAGKATTTPVELAAQLLALITAAFGDRDVHGVGDAADDPDALDSHVQLYRSAAQIGLTQTSARSSKVMRKHNALARRLLDRQDDYLRFTSGWRIPPDNNGSERDVRMIKLRQKVSGCLRTLTGARQFCAIRSYLSTAAKHGQNFFDTLACSPRANPGCPRINNQATTT